MILFPEAVSSFSANTQTHLLYLLPSLPVFIFSLCVFATATILSFSQLHTFSPLIKRKHPCNRTTKWCVLKDMESDMYTRKPFCFHRWPPYMSSTLSIINFSFFRLLLQFFQSLHSVLALHVVVKLLCSAFPGFLAAILLTYLHGSCSSTATIILSYSLIFFPHPYYSTFVPLFPPILASSSCGLNLQKESLNSCLIFKCFSDSLQT